MIQDKYICIRICVITISSGYNECFLVEEQLNKLYFETL